MKPPLRDKKVSNSLSSSPWLPRAVTVKGSVSLQLFPQGAHLLLYQSLGQAGGTLGPQLSKSVDLNFRLPSARGCPSSSLCQSSDFGPLPLLPGIPLSHSPPPTHTHTGRASDSAHTHCAPPNSQLHSAPLGSSLLGNCSSQKVELPSLLLNLFVPFSYEAPLPWLLR